MGIRSSAPEGASCSSPSSVSEPHPQNPIITNSGGASAAEPLDSTETFHIIDHGGSSVTAPVGQHFLHSRSSDIIEAAAHPDASATATESSDSTKTALLIDAGTASSKVYAIRTGSTGQSSAATDAHADAQDANSPASSTPDIDTPADLFAMNNIAGTVATGSSAQLVPDLRSSTPIRSLPHDSAHAHAGNCQTGAVVQNRFYGEYTVLSSGVNDKGSHICQRSYGPGASRARCYHYSNTDGSYYYTNPDESKYYNDGHGWSHYRNPKGEDTFCDSQGEIFAGFEEWDAARKAGPQAVGMERWDIEQFVA